MTRVSICFIILSIYILISSCNIKPAATPEKSVITDSINIQESSNEETIIYDMNSYPVDSLLTATLLITGSYHDGEVPEYRLKEKWIGLFKKGNTYYTSYTKVKTQRVHDDIIDEENEITGWLVEGETKDTAIFLLTGIELQPQIDVNPVFLSNNRIYPGDSLKIDYKNTTYTLFATGRIKGDKSDWPDIWNYKLYLSAKNDGITVTDLISAQASFDDSMVTILFAGDIDGDGMLDLLVDTSYHYNVFAPTLYLSKQAGNNHIIKVVARHVSVGC